MSELAELYDRTVDDVWRTARGSGADPRTAERAVAAAYVAFAEAAGDPEVWKRPRLWLMAHVYRAVREVPTAA